MKMKKIILIPFAFLTIFIAYQYFVNKIQPVSFNKSTSHWIVFADTTKTVNIKLSLSFNADFDTSGRVDGRDLALIAYFFGKEEKDYISNTFKVNPDINGDKIIDGEDLIILASHFGLVK